MSTTLSYIKQQWAAGFSPGSLRAMKELVARDFDVIKVVPLKKGGYEWRVTERSAGAREGKSYDFLIRLAKVRKVITKAYTNFSQFRNIKPMRAGYYLWIYVARAAIPASDLKVCVYISVGANASHLCCVVIKCTAKKTRKQKYKKRSLQSRYACVAFCFPL